MKLLRTLFVFIFALALLSCGDTNSPSQSETEARFTEITLPRTAEGTEAYAAAMLEELVSGYQALMGGEERTFENTIRAFDRLYQKGQVESQKLLLLSSLSPDPQVRAQASAAQMQLKAWFLGIASDAALQDAISMFTHDKSAYSGSDLIMLEKVEGLFADYGSGQSASIRNALLSNNIEYEQLNQQIFYYLANGDPDGLIPQLFVEYINNKTDYATLRGFDSFAEGFLHSTMAKTPDGVRNFIEDADDLLEPPFARVREQLDDLKAAATGDLQATVTIEDAKVYLADLIEQQYGISNFVWRYYHEERFQLENVVSTLFQLFDRVFGVALHKTTPPAGVWQEDVEYFEASDKDSGAQLGSFYLDLYAREGKLGDPRTMLVTPPFFDDDGINHRSVSVVIMDYEKPEVGEARLSINQARSMFHEFGHLLCRLLFENPNRFSNALVIPADFEELHSQLMERFLWKQKVMNSLLGNNLLWSDQEHQAWLESHKLDQLLYEQDTLAFSTINLEFFAGDIASDIDSLLAYQDATYSQLYLPRREASTSIFAIFHQVSLPAQCYGYRWALGMTLDIAAAMEQRGGLLNPVNGRLLREKIYTLDETFNPEERVETLLGRPLTLDAYGAYFGAE